MSTEEKEIDTRPELIEGLSVASELEHGLGIQYLYTAFTIKDSTEEGLTPHELQTVLQWKAFIFMIAAQEMQHLVQATNLLLAVGAGAHLTRPNFPQSPRYYPMKLRWGLWPFSAATLGLYTQWERPAWIPATPREERAIARVHELAGHDVTPEIDSKNPFDKLPEALKERMPRASGRQTIGELYDEIARGFRRIPDVIIGDPAYQVDGREVDFPQVRRILTVPDAERAIRLIVEQGEGDVGEHEREVALRDSHYGVFLRILTEYETLAQRATDEGRVFQPARDCTANPLARLHWDNNWPGYRIIQDPSTRHVEELTSEIYRTMLLMLHRFFATPDDPGLRVRYSQGFLRTMTTILAPLGEMLTKLPMGEDANSWRPKFAGPSFEVTRLSELYPQPLSSQRVIRELLEAEARRARQLAGEGGPRGLLDVAAQLDAIRALLTPPSGGGPSTPSSPTTPTSPAPANPSNRSSAMHALPPMPPGQETFYYASQTTFWIFMKADRKLVKKRLGPDLERLGLSLAKFRGDDGAYLVVTPMVYTATFNNGSAGIPEVEFSALVYPTSQKARVPDLSFEEFLLGWEQQKLVGQLRLDVITDNMGAVQGGREKYGEHKFMGTLTYVMPSPNDNAREPRPWALEFTVDQIPRDAHEKHNRVFKMEATVGGLSSISTNASDIIVYGALPPEPGPGVTQRAIAVRRNHLGTYTLWIADGKHGHVHITYGDCHDAAPLVIDGKPIPGSSEWPKQMRELMAELLDGASPAAYMLFASPPVEIEPRPYYVDPT